MEDLGFVSFVVSNWQLLSGLGEPVCLFTDQREVGFVEFCRCNMAHMAVTERILLMSLSTRNIPSFRELYSTVCPRLGYLCCLVLSTLI